MRSPIVNRTGFVKVRLHGLPEDVEAAVVELNENFRVVSTSKVYEDRNAETIRVYVEIKV